MAIVALDASDFRTISVFRWRHLFGEGAEQVSPRNSVRRGVVLIIQSYLSPKPHWILSLKWCRIAAGDDACWSPSWCSSSPLRPGSSFSLIVSSE
jgi:hypothetical protein